MNDKLPVLNIDGFELSYIIQGSGIDTLVIGSATYYSRLFSSDLQKHLRMIFMDHRGFARATKPFDISSFTLEKLVEDIEVMRLHLGLQKMVLIGHSGHGYIALAYAKKYPQYVHKLVLIALSPHSDTESFAIADRCFAESVCPERKALLKSNLSKLPEVIAQNPSHQFIARMLMFGPMIWYQHDYDASELWSDIEVIPEMFDYVWGDLFKKLNLFTNDVLFTVPVFLALGRYDYWNPPFLWNDDIRDRFTNLTVRIFEKSGHTPQFEEQMLFDNELITWILVQ